MLVSCFTQAITNHTPTGEYCTRFFPNKNVACQCGAELQTCAHILCECPRYRILFPSLHSFYTGRNNFNKLVKFLQNNETAFTFEDAPVDLDDPP